MTNRKRARALKRAATDRVLVMSGEPGRALGYMPTKSVRGDVALLNAITLLKRNRVDLEKSLRIQVRAARRAGVSWERIGAALGVSRQACEKRWGPYPIDAPKVPRRKSVS